jgi:hypothetical protein
MADISDYNIIIMLLILVCFALFMVYVLSGLKKEKFEGNLLLDENYVSELNKNVKQEINKEPSKEVKDNEALCFKFYEAPLEEPLKCPNMIKHNQLLRSF